MILDNEFKFVGEQCRVEITYSENDSSYKIQTIFESIPNLAKIKQDLNEHKLLIEKLGNEEFVPITEICWSGNSLRLEFGEVSGKPFTKLPRLSDGATSSILVQLAKSLEKLHEEGSWSGWLDPRLLYIGEKTVSVALVLPECLQSRSIQQDILEPFVAPEFVDKSLTLDARVDIFGVGAIGFYLLTGEAPPNHGREAKLNEVTESAELREIILKCLSDSPADRYQILGELIEALSCAKLFDNISDSPSLVVLNTDESGQSYAISEGITTLGSCVDSNIRLPKLLNKTAEFNRKDGVTSFKLLANTNASVDKQHLKTGQSRVLTRSSVLEISPYKLRFLAPNEIYSSKAKVELSGSESESQKFFKKAGLIMMGVALFGLGFSIFNAQQDETRKADTDFKTRLEKEKRLGAFIWTGDFYLRSNDLSISCNSVKCTKECQNAIECYSEALALDPTDAYAQSRLSQAQKLSSKVVLATEVPVAEDSQETQLIEKAKGQIQAGNLFCLDGECAETTINQILSNNSLSLGGKDLLLDLAAEAVDRALQARAEGNSGEIEENCRVAVRLGVSEQYLAPLRAGIDVIKRSTSSVVIIDEHTKDEGRIVSSRIYTNDLAERLSANHGYMKTKGTRQVLDISGLDKHN